jgi:hypothetical protein
MAILCRALNCHVRTSVSEKKAGRGATIHHAAGVRLPGVNGVILMVLLVHVDQ